MEQNDCYQVYMREAFGEAIARAHDTEETDQDPTAHAEMKATREASRVLEGCMCCPTGKSCWGSYTGRSRSVRVIWNGSRHPMYPEDSPRAAMVSGLYGVLCLQPLSEAPR